MTVSPADLVRRQPVALSVVPTVMATMVIANVCQIAILTSRVLLDTGTVHKHIMNAIKPRGTCVTKIVLSTARATILRHVQHTPTVPMIPVTNIRESIITANLVMQRRDCVHELVLLANLDTNLIPPAQVARKNRQHRVPRPTQIFPTRIALVVQ